jgi:hypothetical protein
MIRGCYVDLMWLLRDFYVMLRLLCYVRCTNRMDKMTPGTNLKLTSNPKPKLYRVVWAKCPKNAYLPHNIRNIT